MGTEFDEYVLLAEVASYIICNDSYVYALRADMTS